jgi:RNA polymerase sigma-32 factor
LLEGLSSCEKLIVATKKAKPRSSKPKKLLKSVSKRGSKKDNPRAVVSLSAPIEVIESKGTHENLQAYLESIRRYPLLTPENEAKLTQEFREKRDPEIAKLIILANLRLVVKIAHDYARSGMQLLDLIQEGNIGLAQAVQEYDPYRGVKFSSYASYWIKAYIRSFILKNWSLVKIGTTRAQRSLFYRLQKEKSQMELLGIVPDRKLLAERLQVKEKEVDEMSQRLSGRDLSLNAPARRDQDDGDDLLQFIEDPEVAPDLKLAESEIRREFSERLDHFEKSLSGKELVIFRERLRAETPKTLQELGDAYGITRERVRQLEVRVMEKLKEYMQKNAKFMQNVIDV